MTTLELDPGELEGVMRQLDRHLVTVIHKAVELAVEAGAQTAFASARFRDRTGRARGRIMGYLTRLTARGADGRVVCAVPYASFLNEGTRAHPIHARAGGALRWEDGSGDTHYARVVQHPGTSADGFMARGRAMAEMVLKREVARGVAAVDRYVGGV